MLLYWLVKLDCLPVFHDLFFLGVAEPGTSENPIQNSIEISSSLISTITALQHDPF